jgi:hypothetical protein
VVATTRSKKLVTWPSVALAELPFEGLACHERNANTSRCRRCRSVSYVSTPAAMS